MWRDVLGVFLVQVAWVILAHSLDGDKQLRELGFETCLDAFVVHKDKIIRTQDSTEMGAKFLTEVEVEVRFDCMRWCCETPHCDVFIFEEKKPGSCYLFHCGPPNDFKCKFTSHANYSSAVLRSDNMQNADALEEQIRRNQQEHELKSLRKMDSPSREREYDFYTNPPAPRLTDPPPTPSTTTTTLAPVKVPICSRNQFECRSNYDCIAIYNVCDGIPQCPDGSDEAAELGCPGDKTTQPPPPPPPPPVVASPKPPYVPLLPDVIRYQQQMMEQSQQQHAQYPMMYGHGQEVNKNWETNQLRPQESGGYRSGVYVPQQPQQQQSQDDLQQQQQPLPVNNYKPAPYNQWNNNYQGQAIYEQQSKIEEQPPHIFNHKVPGGMRLDEMESQNGMYGGQDPNRVYAPYYSGMIHRDSWQEPPPPPPGPGPAGIPTQAPPTTTTLAPTTPPPCDPAEKNAEAIKTRSSSSSEDKRPNESVEAHPSQQQQHPAQAKAKDNKPALHESKPLPEKLKAESHKARDPAAEQPHSHISITDHVRRVPVVHEDSMSRPKGAVISLALGLSVTAVMAILIACRLRVVKRRGGRRGHDSYAHDADYLVNGMYL